MKKLIKNVMKKNIIVSAVVFNSLNIFGASFSMEPIQEEGESSQEETEVKAEIAIQEEESAKVDILHVGYKESTGFKAFASQLVEFEDVDKSDGKKETIKFINDMLGSADFEKLIKERQGCQKIKDQMGGMLEILNGDLLQNQANDEKEMKRLLDKLKKTSDETEKKYIKERLERIKCEAEARPIKIAKTRRLFDTFVYTIEFIDKQIDTLKDDIKKRINPISKIKLLSEKNQLICSELLEMMKNFDRIHFVNAFILCESNQKKLINMMQKVQPISTSSSMPLPISLSTTMPASSSVSLSLLMYQINCFEFAKLASVILIKKNELNRVVPNNEDNISIGQFCFDLEHECKLLSNDSLTTYFAEKYRGYETYFSNQISPDPSPTSIRNQSIFDSQSEEQKRENGKKKVRRNISAPDLSVPSLAQFGKRKSAQSLKNPFKRSQSQDSQLIHVPQVCVYQPQFSEEMLASLADLKMEYIKEWVKSKIDFSTLSVSDLDSLISHLLNIKSNYKENNEFIYNICVDLLEEVSELYFLQKDNLNTTNL